VRTLELNELRKRTELTEPIEIRNEIQLLKDSWLNVPIRKVLATTPSGVTVSLIVLTLAYLLFASLPPASASESLRGFVHQSKGQLTIALKSSATPFRVTPSSGSHENLSSLHDGDYVILTGNVNQANHTIEIEAIESVGLQALLGIWRTQQWQVFEFRDFNRLNLYGSTMTPPSPVGLEKLREFSYILAPNSDNKFTIILTDDKEVHAGVIELADKSVHLQLFDSKTGQVAQDISLSPLPLN